jgi:hypothetical protein
MSTVALSGSDTIVINNRVFADLADGEVVSLAFPNGIANVKTGKNGNSIYSYNESGKQCDLKVRVIRGSADDKFLNGLLTQQQANFAGFVLLIGEFVKKIGDGKGNISNDTYIMSGGIFEKLTEAKSNVEGDTEQSVSVYQIKFANSPRIIT